MREAALTGNVAAMQACLEAGAPVDARDRYGQTALMLAAVHGHAQLASFLIGKGAGLNHTAKYHLSALMLALINHHADIARMLVEAGADVSIKGSGAPGFSGRTAADIARDSGINIKDL